MCGKVVFTSSGGYWNLSHCRRFRVFTCQEAEIELPLRGGLVDAMRNWDSRELGNFSIGTCCSGLRGYRFCSDWTHSNAFVGFIGYPIVCEHFWATTSK